MAEYFLSKIRVASEDFVEANGRPVLERHSELRALLTERAGPEVASLFAEPLISRGNDAAPPTVSWYTEVEGDARLLSALSPGERDRVEAYLADHLRPLRALADEPSSAEMALGALTVYGGDDVVVVAGKPVIVNWGLMPDGKGANVGTRAAHYSATLGRFLPLAAGANRPVSAPDIGISTMAGASAAAAGGGKAPDQSGASVVDEPVPPRRVISALAWVPLLILLILSGLFLAWLLTPGSRLFHVSQTPPVISDDATLRAARDLNDSLRTRKAVLETAIAGAVCRPDGVLILPDGRTPEGLLPPAVGVEPERKAKAAPDALLPNRPTRVLVPDASISAGEGTLLALIEARTVLVLAAQGEGKVTTGSGFLIGPGLVITNQHVVEPALNEAGQLLVTGGALKQPEKATLLKSHGPLFETGGDFALLQIEANDVPAFSVHLPSTSLKLTNVVAAGYPGDVLETDISFAALKSGNLSAVPGLTVTDGTINTEQQIGPQTHVLMHSAALSSGNSGGPLVDMCGRLVGVNSFVRKGRMQNRGFALTTGDLMAFLNGTGAAPNVISEPCEPVVVRTQVTKVETAKPDPSKSDPKPGQAKSE